MNRARHARAGEAATASQSSGPGERSQLEDRLGGLDRQLGGEQSTRLDAISRIELGFTFTSLSTPGNLSSVNRFS